MQRPGFALKLCCPTAGERWVPPGQGQLVLSLSGSVRVQQRTATTGAESVGAARDQRLQTGGFLEVPNDAHWCLTADDPRSRVLIVSTSVPRTPAGQIDLVGCAPTLRLRPQRVLFANQKLTVSLRALHPLLPLRRALPTDTLSAAGGALVVLCGSLRGSVANDQRETSWEGDLATGALLEFEGKASSQLGCQGRATCAVLLIEARALSGDLGSKGAFSPFVDG